MEIESENVDALLAWLLVDLLSLEQAVSLAVGRVPVFLKPFPPTFKPLHKAAELAVESGQLVPSNDWLSHKACRHYAREYVEPEVTRASFRAWLEKTLSEKLKNGAFFFLAEPKDWPSSPATEAAAENHSLEARERTSLLVIIGALAKEAGLDLSQPHKAGNTIAKILDGESVKLSGRAIGEHLKAVSEAMNSRKI